MAERAAAFQFRRSCAEHAHIPCILLRSESEIQFLRHPPQQPADSAEAWIGCEPSGLPRTAAPATVTSCAVLASGDSKAPRTTQHAGINESYTAHGALRCSRPSDV